MDFLNLELFEEVDAQQASLISGGTVVGIQNAGTIDTGSGDDTVTGINSVVRPVNPELNVIGINQLPGGLLSTGSGQDVVDGIGMVV